MDETFELDLQIKKTDEDERLVFGWLSVAKDASGSVITDSEGDEIDESELEKAAYDHVLYARQAGEMHERIGIGRLVESMVFTTAKREALGIPEGTVPGGWWVGYRIDDDTAWTKVRSGEYSAFSIGGRGRRVA